MTDLDRASSLEIETRGLACEWPLLQSRMASGLVPAGPVSCLPHALLLAACKGFLCLNTIPVAYFYEKRNRTYKMLSESSFSPLLLLFPAWKLAWEPSSLWKLTRGRPEVWS